MMVWMYLTVLVFSALTMYFVHEAYRKNELSKKTFSIIALLETAVLILTAIMLVKLL